MIVTKATRRTVYEQLFKEGVLVAEKDYNKPKHMELDVPNLQVIKLCQSLTSRGYVKTQFSWMYYYYVLTNEGIEYLREWLHLPSEIVPATHKKQARATPAPLSRGPPRGDGAYRAPRGPGGDDGYRRRGAADDKAGAGGDFRPRFAGVGRGQGQAS